MHIFIVTITLSFDHDSKISLKRVVTFVICFILYYFVPMRKFFRNTP